MVLARALRNVPIQDSNMIISISAIAMVRG